MLHTNIDVKHSPIDGHHLKPFMYLSNITHSNLLIWNKWYLPRKDGKYSIVKVRAMRTSNHFVIIKIMYICCEDKIIHFHCIFIV